MASEIQFYKELVDLDKIVDTASHIEGVPQSYIPFYIRRAQLLRKLADQIKRSNFTEAALERKFISYLLADPTKGFNEDEWKKRGKMLRAFEAHHKVPLKFNKLALIDATPAYHFKVGQYLFSDFNTELGNTDLNRISTHKLGHIGSRQIESGIGSVLESLHPRGTNEGFYRLPAAADVTPKEYAQFIFDKNQEMINTANKAVNKPDGLIKGIERRIQEQLDASNTGFQVGVSDPQDIYQTVNSKRRLILDKVEIDFGLGHRQLRAGLPDLPKQVFNQIRKNPGGALGGFAAAGYTPEILDKLEAGDVTGAALDTTVSAAAGAVVENVVQQGLQRLPTAIQAPVSGALSGVGPAMFAGMIGGSQSSINRWKTLGYSTEQEYINAVNNNGGFEEPVPLLNQGLNKLQDLLKGFISPQ